MIVRKGIVLSLLLVVCALPALAAPRAAEGAAHWFAPWDMTAAHTAKVSVVLLNIPGGEPSFDGVMLWAEIFFFDAEGKVLSRSGRHQLMPGRAISREFSVCPSDPSVGSMAGDGAFCDPRVRNTFRAGVIVTGDLTGKRFNPSEFVTASATLIDNATQSPAVILLPAVQSMVIGPPDPDAN